MRLRVHVVLGIAAVSLGVLSGAVGAFSLDGSSDDRTESRDRRSAAGCSELAAAGASEVELERVFDPTTGQLRVVGQGGTYEFNVADQTCRTYPAVATLVDDVLSVYKEDQAQECAGIQAELAAVDPGLLAQEDATLDSPKGEMNLQALVRYGEEVCGGRVPGSPRP